MELIALIAATTLLLLFIRAEREQADRSLSRQEARWGSLLNAVERRNAESLARLTRQHSEDMGKMQILYQQERDVLMERVQRPEHRPVVQAETPPQPPLEPDDTFTKVGKIYPDENGYPAEGE